MASAPLELSGIDDPPEAAVAGACRADGIHIDSWRSAVTPALRGAWAELERAATEPNPFYSTWALVPALEAFDPDGRVRLARFVKDGRLCGLVPLVGSRSYYGYPLPHLAAWVHDNAFCGLPLVRKGEERAFWRALLAAAGTLGREALFLHLVHFPADGPLFTGLRDVVREGKLAGTVAQRSSRAMLRSRSDPESYFEASLSGKKRKELRRQHRRLSEEGTLAFARDGTGENLDPWIEEFLALELGGWKGAGGSALASDRRTRQFFHRALHAAAGAGRLERLDLRLDGKPIAMLANFLVPPGAFSFKTAFDEDYARYSPGVLLQRENLALLSRTDIDWADSCAAADHPMIERIWREKREMLRLNLAIGGRLRQAIFRLLAKLERGSAPIGE